MGGKVITCCMPIIATLIFTASTCFGFDDGDFQYWNTEKLTYKVNKYVKIGLEEEFRFGDNAGDFYYQHSDVGATIGGFAEWLELGLNYRLVFEEDGNDWDYENRPHFNGTLKLDLGPLKFSTRNRFELRFRKDAKDGWRYRNKFTLKMPKMTQWELQPYIADEIFVDFIKEELNGNRLYGGISMKFIEHLTGDIFYMWQARKSSGHWKDAHVFGTTVTIAF